MLFKLFSQRFARATCTTIRTYRHSHVSFAPRFKAHDQFSSRRPFSAQAPSTLSPASKRVKKFLKSARHGKATIRDAAQLLQASQDDIKSRAQSIHEQRKEASAVGAAEILDWLLQLPHQTWEDDIDHAFTRPFCWHVEAEGRSKFLIDWLSLWEQDHSIHQHVRPRGEAKRPYYIWPSHLLASILQAKLELAEDGRADEAIQLLCSFTKRRNNLLFVGPSFVVVTKAISSEKARLSVAAYNAFISILPRNYNGDRLKLASAQLALFHPTKPNAMALLRIPSDLTSTEKIGSIKARRGLSVTWLRAAYTLRLQGDSNNAAHAEAQCRQLNSGVWDYRRKAWARVFRHEPQLTTLHESSPYTDTIWK